MSEKGHFSLLRFKKAGLDKKSLDFKAINLVI
jgi:hypothetical protein